jgi:hypothetical protein
MMPPNMSAPAPQHPLSSLATVVDARATRLVLAALVIASLLPVAQPWWWRIVFVCCFGAELVARFVVWRKDSEHRAVNVVDAGFVAVDVLAFVSFFPLEALVGNDLVALLRLTRLFVLARFGQGLAKDLYAVLTRREQLQTLGLVTGAVVVLSCVSAVVLSQLRVDVAATDGASFRERLWWSFRQLESADNIVPDLTGNPVLITLSLVLTICGVFLISFVIGVGSNVVDQVIRAERRRSLDYRGHTIVLGAVHESEELIREFVRIYAKNRQVPSPERLLTWLRAQNLNGARAFPRVALVARDDVTPDFLVEPIMRWVVYRQGDESDPTALRRVNVAEAKRAIILARRELGYEADAVSISALAALRAENVDCQAYVEVDTPEARDIVLQVGGNNTVVLDMPRFLGMFLCQHLLMPGVDALYRDLLTSEGTEIYTHVFVDVDDQQALARLPPTVSFAALSALAHQHGVHLLGVYLGEATASRNRLGVVQIDGLVHWLNPTDIVVDERLLALGAQQGSIPTRTLRGLIGIADTWLPLRALASAIARGEANIAQPANGIVDVDSDLELHRASDVAEAALEAPARGPQRVALIGSSDSLPSLLRELSLFVDGVDVLLFLSSRDGDADPIKRRLAALNIGFDVDDPLPGRGGRTFVLNKGGAVRVFTHDAPDLAQFAAEHLRELPAVDAVVFLGEPEGTDLDARTAMRVLRFLRRLEDGTVPHGDHLHLVAEFISIEKGQYLQRHVDIRRCGFAHDDDLRLTLIAKETIKAYFMVHAAFVPGVSAIYDELLEERGQDVVRFGIAVAARGRTTWGAVCAALNRRCAVAIGLQRRDGQVVLAPAPATVLDLADLSGVYAVAETQTLGVPPRV